MVWLIFAIGLLNLCLGYAMAVCLGYGPPQPWGNGKAPLAPPSIDDASSDRTASVEELIHEVCGESAPRTTAPQSPHPEEVPGPAEESAASLGEKWSAVIAKGASRLQALKAHLGECEGHCDRETIWRSVVELQEICETYLRQQDRAAERFSECFRESDEAAAGRQLEEAILAQSAQLETTISNLRHINFESDLPATSGRLLAEIERMLRAGRELQDGIQALLPTL